MLYVGTSGVVVTVDSLAGTPGMVPTLNGATCTLVVSLNVDPRQGTTPSRVPIPTNRFTPTGDGRTYAWALEASDIPLPGTYSLQMTAVFGGGETLLSQIGTIFVAAAV